MRVLRFFLFLTFVFVPRVYAANCGGAVPCKCGDKVTQDYVMTTDLGPCLLTHGLLIGNGVTLNGNGHRISGPAGLLEVYGVYLNGTTGAIVKNLLISGFLRGIRLAGAQGNQILDNETFQNGNFVTHVGYGIDMASGAKNNLLQGNLIHNNADEGIHFGSGSGENAFIDNTVYDNYIENIYFIASHNNTIVGNVTHLGQTSVYLKDSTGNVLQDNTFRDKIVHVRGDSYDNQFINNTLVNTGFHFQAYTSDTPFRYPHDNTVKGGKITYVGGTCLRFSSSWDNFVTDIVLNGCGTDLRLNSDAAQSRNAVIGVGFSPSKVQLEGTSVLTVGWRLDAHVQDTGDNSLEDVRVKVTDATGRLLFDGLTGPDGNIATQNVIAYIKTDSTQTLFTPLSLEIKKTGFQSNKRQATLTDDTALTIVLVPEASSVNSPPIANAGANQSVLLADVVSFDGSRSRDPDGDPLTYLWDFGDGDTATGAIVTHAYKSPGSYLVMLTVSDESLTSSDTVTIIITSLVPPNSPPVANAGFDLTVNAGKQIVFDGSDSTDSDGDTLSYSWDFGDGSTGNGVKVSHLYTTPGAYTVTLMVSDGQLSTTDSASVAVQTEGRSLRDTFDRPDSSILGNGWVEITGDLVIEKQELGNASLKGIHLAVLPELSGSTQNVAVDFASLNNNPGPRFGVVLRFQDPQNYYLLYRQAGGTSALRISKIVNGKEKLLASTAITNPGKDAFFRLYGTANEEVLTLEVEGKKYLTVSDSTFSDGSLGILLDSGAAVSQQADNFNARVQ